MYVRERKKLYIESHIPKNISPSLNSVAQYNHVNRKNVSKTLTIFYILTCSGQMIAHIASSLFVGTTHLPMVH